MLPSLKDIDPKLQLVDLDRADCEESLYEFYKAAWKYIDPSPWADSWAIDAMCEHLQAVVDGQIKQLIINCPPRIGKSSLSSVTFPVWVWAQPLRSHTSGAGVRFLHASYNDKLSLRDSVKCRRLIGSKWYQDRWNQRFQLTSDQATKSRFTNDQGGERLITSISAGVTGEGGDCFVAGTMVSTPSGARPIEQLMVGDTVLSFDLLRGKVLKSKIIATKKRSADALCTIHAVSGRRFTCTQDHPIYSPGRGFVPAGEMGPGDRLLVAGEAGQWPNININTFVLRSVWERNEATSLLGAQGIETGKSRCLLQQEMLLRASCGKTRQTMRSMRKATEASWVNILFRPMQIYRTICASAEAHLSKLWGGICGVATILHLEMCRSGTFFADAWIEKFEVQGIGEIFQPVQRNERDNYRERWIPMRRLFGTRREGAPWMASKVISSRPSHRRESAEQFSGKSDNALRDMSQVTPSWEISHIEKVQCHGDATVYVYDIQVEGQSNFFAECILVHNCIIIDDPQAANEIASEANIQEVLDWWSTVMPTRRNNLEHSAVILIQQRLARNDLTGDILEKEADGWTHLMLPGRYEPDRSFITTIGWKDPRTEAGELLWPERFSEKSLCDLEKRMGPFVFAGQIQQRPEPAGGGIIKREWWRLWESKGYPEMDFILACLDTAYTEDKSNDPSGMIIWGIFSKDMSPAANTMVDQHGKMFYLDKREGANAPKALLTYAWDEHLELHQLVEKVAATCKSFKVDLLLIENKASGISVAQEIRRLYNNERFSVRLFDPKSQDKFARLYSVQHLFAEGMIYAPDKEWSDRVIDQVASFGGKPPPKHDEYVDLTSMGLRHLRDTGLLMREPERLFEQESLVVYPRGQDVPLYPT